MRLIVLYAVLLHIIWAVSLIINPAVSGVTGIHILLHYMGSPLLTAIVLLAAAVFAVLGCVVWQPYRAFFLLPQQLLLLLSASGALWAMITAQYADGVLRTHTFLIADQAPALLAAAFHTIAIVVLARREIAWTNR